MGQEEESSTSRPASFSTLAAIIDRIHDGPWRLIQLRGDTLSTNDIGRGDVDFLADRASVDQLLRSVFAWTLKGECHAIIRSRNGDKVALEILAPHGRSSVRFDLWIELWQIAGGRSCLRFEDCRPLIDSSPGITRLPSAVEAAIYLEHLVSKKKKLDSNQVRRRLAHYESACAAAGFAGLSECLAAISRDGKIAESRLAVSRSVLANSGLASSPRIMEWLRHKASSEIRAAWLDAPKRARCVSIMGCDGSGKTSLIRTLRQLEPDRFTSYVGKRLYRNSILYKTAVIFIRPLLFQGRERFDDTLAPFNYLRAAAALSFLIFFSRVKLTLIDRSLVDFLLVDRKSDNPRFHRTFKLTRIFGRRIPVIHLLVPEDCLSERKREMTATGHAKYDMTMFNFFSSGAPTVYMLFHNGNALNVSADVVRNVVLSSWGHDGNS